MNKPNFQDICISAVKEKDIEAKLKQVISEWNHEELTFSQFKVSLLMLCLTSSRRIWGGPSLATCVESGFLLCYCLEHF